MKNKNKFTGFGITINVTQMNPNKKGPFKGIIIDSNKPQQIGAPIQGLSLDLYEKL